MRSAGVFLAALTLVFIIGCAGTPSAESIKKGQDLAYNRCTGCHPAAKWESKRYSRGEWLSIIDRMQTHGAQFSPDEISEIADYLSVKHGRK